MGDPRRHLRRDLLLEEMGGAEARVRRVTAELDKRADARPGVALLRTVPGVGPRTAEVFVAYVDDVRRFARTRQVGCYLGLVPCQDASAGRDRLGHITGNGPATVRLLLCEAAWREQEPEQEPGPDGPGSPPEDQRGCLLWAGRLPTPGAREGPRPDLA